MNRRTDIESTLLKAYTHSSRSLQEILNDLSGQGHPLISQWQSQHYRCQELMDSGSELTDQDRNGLEAFQTALADPSLKILHLIMWAGCPSLSRHPHECRRILDAMLALASPETDPFIQLLVECFRQEAWSFAPSQGELGFDNSRLEKLIDAKHPRHAQALAEVIATLMNIGGLQLSDELLKAARLIQPHPLVDASIFSAKIVMAFRHRDVARIEKAITDLESYLSVNPKASLSASATRWREHFENLVAIYEGREPPHSSTPGHRLQVIRAEAALMARRPEAAMEALSQPTPGMSPPYQGCLRLIAIGALGDVSRMRTLIQSAEHPVWPTVNLQCLVQEGRWPEAKALYSQLSHIPDERARLITDRSILAGISPLDWIRLESSLPGEPLLKAPTAELQTAASADQNAWHGRGHRSSRVRQLLVRLSKAEVPVSVVGPSGSGKSLAARILHESGPRARHPLVFVTCASIVESLMESELFGHARGAFTGALRARVGLLESAGKGTVVLEEIGDLPPRIQASLLRVLEEKMIRPLGSTLSRPLHCRIVATSSAPLETLVESGRLRNDLMYRLNAAVVTIPSLASRKSDIAHLARHFVAGTHCALSPELLKTLLRHSWPGHVRQLKNLMEQILMHSPGRQILTPSDIPREHRHLFGVSELPPPPNATASGIRPSPGERRRRILQLALDRGAVYPKDLYTLFPEKRCTLSRDLAALTREGKLRRQRHSHAYEPA